MGKMSRDKGARGEREWAAECRAQGYCDVVRTAQHAGKNGGEADVKGLPGLHVEVKRTESLRLHDAIAQSKRDAKDGALPIVAHKRNHDDWVVSMPATSFFEIYREFASGLALEGPKVDTWAD